MESRIGKRPRRMASLTFLSIRSVRTPRSPLYQDFGEDGCEPLKRPQGFTVRIRMTLGISMLGAAFESALNCAGFKNMTEQQVDSDMRHSWGYGKTSRPRTWFANDVVASAERGEKITRTDTFDPLRTFTTGGFPVTNCPRARMSFTLLECLAVLKRHALVRIL